MPIKKIVFRTALASMIIAGSTAASQAAKKKVRADVRDKVVALMAADTADEPVPVSRTKLRSAVRIIDINQDGIADFAADWGKISLPGWCGTGGCRYQMWLGSKEGTLVPVFDLQVRDHKMRKAKGEVVFDFDFHGSACATFGASACPASFAWDGKAGIMAERVTAGGDGMIRFVQPVSRTAAVLPSEAQKWAKATKNLCADMKAEAVGDDDQGNVIPISIPDVDGDGARDWAFHGEACRFADDRPDFALTDVLVLTSGDPAIGVSAMMRDVAAISVSTVPATVYDVQKADDCQTAYVQPDEKPCPRRALKWNAAKKQFDPA